MVGEDVVDPALQLLSVAIGMIMEDHADEAITRLPADPEARRERFDRLHAAGRDIAAVAEAARALLRRRTAP